MSDGEEYTVNETTTVLDVVIPKNMLWNNIKKNYTIYVFLLSTNEESGETLKRIIMPVRVKPKPIYSVTPEDEELFHRVVEEVNTFAETAKEHSNISKSYAVGNTGTRENEDIDNAKYYAEQSALSAEASEQSASNALVSENHALDSENSALGAESRARAYATEARDLKQEYDNTLALTKEYRDSAQASAISASANLRDTVTARNIATQASADANNFLNQTQAVYDLTVEIKQEVDETKADVDITKTEVDAIKTDIDATKADITTTRTEIATTKAEVNTAKNEVIAIKSEVSDIKDATDEIKTDVISIANNINNSISEHNESTTAHSDIRSLISNLTNKLNTFLDTDDESLDQISELITFIQNNRTLIEGITTSKVDKNQGIENASKGLIVGEDGYITLGDISEGSASYYPVEITLVDSTYQTDHTCQEISNAFKSGLIPYAFIHGVEQNIYHLMTCSEYLVSFVYLTEDNVSIITISQNNTVTVNINNPIIHAHQDISHKADKATTLSGYGITNAYTKGEVDNIINNLDTGVTSVNNKTGNVTITAQELGALTEHQDISGKADRSEILIPLIGNAENITPQQVMECLEEGRDVSVSKEYEFNDTNFNLTFTAWNRVTDAVYEGQYADLVISNTIAIFNGVYYLFEMVGGVFNGEMPWLIVSQMIVTPQHLVANYYDKDDINDIASSKANKSEIPTVPTNVSAFTNDSGYINDLSSYIYYSQNTNTVYINSATEITDADEASF